MKRAFLIAACAVFAPLFAAELPIHGDFKDSPLTLEVPNYWTRNVYTKGPELGSGKLFEKDGKRFYNVKSNVRLLPFYSEKASVKPGDTVKMEVTVSGKGKVGLAAYAYNAKGGYLRTLTLAPATDVTAGKVQGALVIPAEPAGIDNVRFVFEVGTNADVNLSDVKAERIDKK